MARRDDTSPTAESAGARYPDRATEGLVEESSQGQKSEAAGTRLVLFQGAVALLMLVPVTLPVPVLRTLVHERFAVSELATSAFMSINMVGALLVAPWVGALADRIGRRKRIALAALALDALCFMALTLPIPFALFMGIRLVEGAAHIAALSMLLSLASTSVADARRGRSLGMVGAGLLLGVALGAPLGGWLGREDPLLPLRAGGIIVALAAVLAALVLRDPDRPGEPRAKSAGLLVALRAESRLLIPLLFAFADRFTVGFYTATFSLYLSRVHELAPPQIGLLISAFMLPFALLSYPFGWLSERTSRVLLLGVGSVVYGLGTATLVSWPPEMLVYVMAAIGVSAAVMFVPTLMLTTEYASDELRSTAMGAFNAAGSLGFILGPIVGGLVSESVAMGSDWLAGYRAAFWVAGGSEIVLVAVALPFLRARRGRPA